MSNIPLAVTEKGHGYKKFGKLVKAESVKELQEKAKAFDAIMKECQDNPTKSRTWVLSLMKRNLKKVQETS